MRIVLGSSRLLNHQQVGGHWAWFLQYPFGLKALGHDVFWIEIMATSGDRGRDERLIRDFFQRLAPHGLDRACAVLLFNGNADGNADIQPLEQSELFGRSRADLLEIIRSADLLLNFCCLVRSPLLSMFKWRVLLDFDPGHLQVSALSWDLPFREHDVLLTIGARLHAPDCTVPTLGLTWRTFEPLAYLPMWQPTPDPGPLAPFTSVTQWTWEELPWQGGLISISKRAAYLEYVALPRLADRPFELAANIDAADPTRDREWLHDYGWRVADPHRVRPRPRSTSNISVARGPSSCAPSQSTLR